MRPGVLRFCSPTVLLCLKGPFSCQVKLLHQCRDSFSAQKPASHSAQLLETFEPGGHGRSKSTPKSFSSEAYLCERVLLCVLHNSGSTTRTTSIPQNKQRHRPFRVCPDESKSSTPSKPTKNSLTWVRILFITRVLCFCPTAMADDPFHSTSEDQGASGLLTASSCPCL